MSRRTVIVLTILLLAITGLPVVYAFRAGGGAHVFAGILFNPNDGNSYLAKMLQGWNGAWRFVLPYTAEPGQGAYLFLFYLFLGHLARWIGLPLLLVYHLARLIGAALLVAALARFFRLVFDDARRAARMALILAVFGSGMGWLALLWGGFASDMWVAEAYPFLSAYANPHFPLGLALLLFGFERFLQPFNARNAGLLFVTGLLLAIILPFGLVVAAMMCGGLVLWNWISTRRLDLRAAVAFFLAGGLALVYQYVATLRDPVLAGWNAQNVTTSPALWDVLLSFSPALLLALPGGWAMWRQREKPANRLVLLWLVLGLLLVYVPFNLQRRFMLGYFIPVAAAGVAGLQTLLRTTGLARRAGFPALLALSVITNLGVLGAGFYGIQTRAPDFYRTPAEQAALEWIQANTPPRALILADSQMGLWIPAVTGRRVVYGHPFETVNAVREQAALAEFTNDDLTAEQAQQYLESRGVDYVLVTGRMLRTDLPGSMPVFEEAEVKLYRVR